MPDYRLYCRNGSGRFSDVYEISAASDVDALAKARAMKIAGKCELWERGRIIAVLDPHQGPSS
jgi:hypothetical protein